MVWVAGSHVLQPHLTRKKVLPNQARDETLKKILNDKGLAPFLFETLKNHLTLTYIQNV